MTSGLQNTFIKEMAESGCYFLCLCEIAERVTGKQVDVLTTAINAWEHNWIYRDFTVQDPAAILHDLTGKKVTVEHSKTKPTNYSWIVEKWTNPRTGFRHFRLPDWDSLTASVTVKEGKIDSYRVIKINE